MKTRDPIAELLSNPQAITVSGDGKIATFRSAVHFDHRSLVAPPKPKAPPSCFILDANPLKDPVPYTLHEELAHLDGQYVTRADLFAAIEAATSKKEGT